MRKKYLLFILSIIVCHTSIAQNGYFGKKTVISVDGILKGNVIYNMLLTDFDYSDGTMNGKRSSRPVGGGMNVSVSHYFRNTIGIGIDFNLVANYIKTPNEFMDYYYDANYGGYYGHIVALQELKMRTYYIVPKVEWNSNGNLPVGFSHSIGFGYAGSFIVDDNYKMTLYPMNYGSNYPSVGVSSSKRGSDFRPVHGFVVEYGAKIRFPITSFMAFNLGSTLKLHVPFPHEISEIGSSPSLEGNVRRSMRVSRGSYLMDIRAGLSFILF